MTRIASYFKSLLLIELMQGLGLTLKYLFKCIYCGFCEESCPVDSIVETHIHEYHFDKRGQNIVNKQQLLAIGDRLEAEIAERRAADAPFR